MPRYRLTAPAYVGGRHYDASLTHPAVVEVPDDVQPSRTWEPLDDAARAAMARLPALKVVQPTPKAAPPNAAAPTETTPSAATTPAAAPTTAAPVKPKRPTDKEG